MPLRFAARILLCCLAFSIFCICAVAQTAPQAPFGACDSRELKYRLSPNNPAYGSAMRLAQTLANGGIKVSCVLPSKMANFFVGQKGAALFRTDHGAFEALFAFEPEQFASLAVVERTPEGRLHTYEIYGIPNVRTMQGREAFFLKHETTFFVAWDYRIARSLAEIYGQQSRLNP
jgi:hypothetical protein